VLRALPRELSGEQQLALVRAYVKDNFVDKGMCADFAIHDKGTGNPHVHIMLTLRPLKENGQWGAKCRKAYDLDENGQRIPDGKGGWKNHILAYPCQVRRVSRHTFAYRKTAVQVSPYGGRLFICRTSRCVCRCGPASAPEHHPLCGRQAASPGECDIPDGLPNRRTGHGHGSYPAAVRPLPAMLRPAPAVRSSSHA